MNPFSPINEPEKFSLFKDVTDAIDRWMIEKYPEFDKKLLNKLQRCEEIQNHIEISFSNHKTAIKTDKEETLKYFKNEINGFLDEKYPGMASQLSIMHTDGTILIDQIKEKYQKNKILDKKIFESKNLTQDVYRMKDEMDSLKKQFEDLSRKLKNLFK